MYFESELIPILKGVPVVRPPDYKLTPANNHKLENMQITVNNIEFRFKEITRQKVLRVIEALIQAIISQINESDLEESVQDLSLNSSDEDSEDDNPSPSPIFETYYPLKRKEMYLGGNSRNTGNSGHPPIDPYPLIPTPQKRLKITGGHLSPNIDVEGGRIDHMEHNAKFDVFAGYDTSRFFIPQLQTSNNIIFSFNQLNSTLLHSAFNSNLISVLPITLNIQ